MDMNYNLGLDIGVSSVGWGLIDENLQIIDAGVRIFTEADKKENEERREKRGSRRRLRRRNHRQKRIKDLLVEYGIIKEDFNFEIQCEKTPYHLRVKGLYNKLSKEEFAIALYHLSKRRGIHNVDDFQEENIKSELSTKKIIGENNNELDGRYVCELQLERLEDNDSKVRGLKNRFTSNQYEDEFNKLINTQINQGYFDNSFEQKARQIIFDRREYFEGPGQGSFYGWDGDTEKWLTSMMGNCLYFPSEKRIVKHSYTAETFNLLNDLNNITVKGEKISYEDKMYLVDNIFKKQLCIKSISKISQYFNVASEDIQGYRKTMDDKPDFTELKLYHTVKKYTNNQEILNDHDLLDKIGYILTIYQTNSEKYVQLKKLNINNQLCEELSKEDFKGSFSISKKAIKLILDDLWKTSKNQLELFSQLKLRPARMNLEGLKSIPTNYVENWIISPVLKRSLTQSIKIVNTIIKKYGYPKEINIEFAREKNSQDRKKMINILQRDNKILNDQVIKIINDNNISDHIFEKIKLWILQDGKCMYSLEKIDLNDLIIDHTKFEIDHIIPKSISFDDTLSNKVLVKLSEYQKKGECSPYQYLNSKNGKITYNDFRNYVLSIKDKKQFSEKKRYYLLDERNIFKWEVRKDYINRNLVDTRYAAREFKNFLKLYFNDNNIDVKIKSINKSYTYYLRKLWNFRKDNEEDYKNYSNDALLIAISSNIFSSMKLIKDLNNNNANFKDIETGEILDDNMFENKFKEKISAIERIKIYNDYKYSHKVDKKPNRGLFNDTIYSTKKIDDNEMVINKISNLYDSKNTKIKEFFSNPKKYEKLLCYKNDKITFDILMNIYNTYSKAKNPFAVYYNEFGEIRKYSKKDNGPKIKSLKYIDRKLGNHKDISSNYNTKDKKIVLLHVRPYRMDVYKNKNNIYKFVTITYSMLKNSGSFYEVDKDFYNICKNKKGIDKSYSFLFSIFKKDIIDIDGKQYIFIGVNSDETNKIECDEIKYKSCKRIFKTITNKTNYLNKIQVDILGNEYCNKEKLKLLIEKS